MRGRFKAGFEFRKIKVRWQIFNDLDFAPHYNIAPTQMHPIVVECAGGLEARLMKSSYIILETELSPAEVDGLREVTRHAPAKSGISKKVRDRLVTFGYIEQRIGRLIPTAKGILYFARHRREHLRISHLIRNH